jgi:hypothetical protein
MTAEDAKKEGASREVPTSRVRIKGWGRPALCDSRKGEVVLGWGVVG